MTDIRISPRYWLSDWQGLNFEVEADWQKAIDIVEDRIKGRFVRWIDQIVDEDFSGFVVVALDCLLLETLYGFQQGQSTRDTQRLYAHFLTSSMRFGFDQPTATFFYKDVRCGIVHDTETRRGWIIRWDPQEHIVEKDKDGNFIMNRSMFHAAIKGELDDWLERLRNGDTDAREKMKKRMQDIIAIHFAK